MDCSKRYTLNTLKWREGERQSSYNWFSARKKEVRVIFIAISWILAPRVGYTGKIVHDVKQIMVSWSAKYAIFNRFIQAWEGRQTRGQRHKCYLAKRWWWMWGEGRKCEKPSSIIILIQKKSNVFIFMVVKQWMGSIFILR